MESSIGNCFVGKNKVFFQKYEEVSSVFQKRVSKEAKPVAHIYTFAIAWLFWFFLGQGIFEPDIYSVITLVVLAGIPSLIVYGTLRLIKFVTKKKVDEKTNDILASDLVKKGDADAKAILEALEQLKALQVENDRISHPVVSNVASEIIQVSREILGKVTKKPELLPSIGRFLDHYLPMMNNFLSDYHYMENLSVKGENVHTSMKKIEHALNMLNDAFKKQLDALFSNSALNLEVDMDVLENILKKDGLIDDDSMRMSSKKEI